MGAGLSLCKEENKRAVNSQNTKRCCCAGLYRDEQTDEQTQVASHANDCIAYYIQKFKMSSSGGKQVSMMDKEKACIKQKLSKATLTHGCLTLAITPLLYTIFCSIPD
jgi:hypothetical protein